MEMLNRCGIFFQHAPNPEEICQAGTNEQHDETNEDSGGRWFQGEQDGGDDERGDNKNEQGFKMLNSILHRESM